MTLQSSFFSREILAKMESHGLRIRKVLVGLTAADLRVSHFYCDTATYVPFWYLF